MNGVRRGQAVRRTAYARGSAVKRRAAGTVTGAERHRVIKLAVCLAVFAAALAVKLISPGFAARAGDTMSYFLNRDTDFKAAFSSIGDAVTDEGKLRSVLKSLYGLMTGKSGETDGQEGRAVSGDQEGADAQEGARPSGGTQDAAGAEASGQADGVKTPATPEPTAAEGAMALRAQLNAGLRELALEAAETETSAAPAVSLKDAFIESQKLYAYLAVPANVSYGMPEISFDYAAPLTGALESGFGYREHPIEGKVLFHYGIDIAGNTGDPIAAFAAGTVLSVGESTESGLYVQLTHADGYMTFYGHCSRLLVKSGDAVALGQKIAEVGATGEATGPHLHFELYRNSILLNPAYYVAPESICALEG